MRFKFFLSLWIGPITSQRLHLFGEDNCAGFKIVGISSDSVIYFYKLLAWESEKRTDFQMFIKNNLIGFDCDGDANMSILNIVSFGCSNLRQVTKRVEF